MKKRTFVLGLPILLNGLFAITGFALPATPSPAEIKALTKKVADWQIETFEESGDDRAISSKGLELLKETGKKPRKYHDLAWHMGALYAGMDQWRTVADDSTVYDDWLKMIGGRNEWSLHRRPYHADDHTVGQFYLSLYEEFNDPAMMGPTQERFDWILANPKTGSLEWSGYGEDKDKTDCHNRWGWCDALFMAPPVWARLAKITGESKYLDFMDQEYHATLDLLWNKEDRLFWRDSSYFPKREGNGSKLYWARGNGWVFGGLALMIPDLPEDWEGRAFYIDLFKQMAESLKNCQRKDGTWSMGLLGGPEGYPLKETSGTSFFTFGLAWGINNGILDRATYEPIIFKAWAALTECVTEEGMLGYVQPVGAAPGDSYADKTEVYGIGAFLAAGTEVYKMVGGTVALAPKKSLAQTAEPFTIAVLPDTQFYCDTRLKLSAQWGNGDLRRYFFEQTEWVRDNQERLNIAFLVHEGDIVQADDPEEWAIAKKAMSVLDGKVPYCMCLGNHDMGFEKSDNKYGGKIAVNRTTHFNTYFPREKFAKRREFGGTFDPDRHDNSWYHFEAAGMKFLIVALEYHPRDEVLDWANVIVAEHPDHRVIVLTHAYLKRDQTRTTNRLKLKGNNGEQMWQKFVRKHRNMFMVLCAHFSGEAVLTSTGDHGNPIHQILSDYQGCHNGGESWLRYMVFQPEANQIGIYTYNPALDKFWDRPSSRFDLDYPMAPVQAFGQAVRQSGL